MNAGTRKRNISHNAGKSGFTSLNTASACALDASLAPGWAPKTK